MSKKQTERSVLSNTNSVAVLVYLYRAGGSAKVSYILESVKNFNSIKSAGSRLEEANLITITEHTGRSGYFLYELTDLGRSVAQHLDAAECAMSGEHAECGKLSTNHGASPEQRDQVG